MSDNLQEKLDENLLAWETHNRRLGIVTDKLFSNVNAIKVLNQDVISALAYAGLDLKSQDILEKHNQCFMDLYDSIEDVGYAVETLGEDVSNTVTFLMQIIDDIRKEINEYVEEDK